jgi:hypothetical protein
MNQQSTVPAANPQALLNSYLYKFNLSMADMKEHRAAEADCYGQVGCAKLLRIQRDNYLTEAQQYAPKPEPVAFCAAARAALRLHGPARLTSGQGYALVTKYVKIGA